MERKKGEGIQRDKSFGKARDAILQRRVFPTNCAVCVVEDYIFTLLRAPKDLQRGVSHDRTGAHVATGAEGACDVSHSQQEL